MNSRPAILVTGGAGYLGSHCCRALEAHPLKAARLIEPPRTSA